MAPKIVRKKEKNTNSNKEWTLQNALAYVDDRQLNSQGHLSCVFIEPPDEDGASCEELDENVTPSISTTKLQVNCEIVLRNRKRLKPTCEEESCLDDESCSDDESSCGDQSCCDDKSNRGEVSCFHDELEQKPLPKGKRPKVFCDSSKYIGPGPLQSNKKPFCDDKSEKVRPFKSSSTKFLTKIAPTLKHTPKQKPTPKKRTPKKPTPKITTTLNKKPTANKKSIPKITPALNKNPTTKKKSMPNTKSTPKNKSKSKKEASNDFVWVDDISKPLIPIFPSPNYTDCSDMTSYEQFEKFFDNELLQLIVNESSRYAAYLGKPDPKITLEELKVYIAILIISGYSVQSRFESYWSRDPDLRNEAIYQSMRKNRFKQVTQFLHFQDMNKPDATDKIWKLRPLTDYLKKKLLKNFHPEQNLAYDESMIEYYGRHGMKQCLKDKPIPFGFKVWSLCTPSGYMTNFEIYQGKNPRATTLYEERYGKCIAPLFKMIEDFENDVRALPFSFFFDNLFTGIPALVQLKALGYDGTGTIRENRLPKGCPLKQTKKENAKLNRGYMISKTIEGLDIHITKWVDNSTVKVASTVYGMDPLTVALRYSSAEKKKIEVSRPLVVAKYNQYMGGVDRMDENISLYRIGIHGKKWWSCIFTWMIDVAIQNAWQLHRVGHPDMPHLDFRRQIALYYCRRYGIPPKATGNRKRKWVDSSSSRFDNVCHWPQYGAKRRRCAGETCTTIGKTVCGKCDKGLCIRCFESYHSLDKFKQ